MLKVLRRLRHGPLKGFGSFWLVLGNLYRIFLATLNIRMKSSTRIGRYGPFFLDGRFAFSNFEDWGQGKNEAFDEIIETARGANCVLDVGAHIGLISLPVSRVIGNGGKIFAFEPAESNRYYLGRHLAINDIINVDVIDALVGENDADEVTFYEAEGDNPMNSVAHGDDEGFYAATKKRQVCIDTFCQHRELTPDIIKIDVEGAEIGVLKGARGVIERCRPMIFLSVHPRQISDLGQTTGELARLIEEMDYDCFDHLGEPVSELQSTEYVLRPKAS